MKKLYKKTDNQLYVKSYNAFCQRLDKDSESFMSYPDRHNIGKRIHYLQRILQHLRDEDIDKPNRDGKTPREFLNELKGLQEVVLISDKNREKIKKNFTKKQEDSQDVLHDDDLFSEDLSSGDDLPYDDPLREDTLFDKDQSVSESEEGDARPWYEQGEYAEVSQDAYDALKKRPADDALADHLTALLSNMHLRVQRLEKKLTFSACI